MSVNGLTRVILDDHELPAGLEVAHVEVRRIAMQPDVTAGPHEHNGPVFGVIERGSVRFQIDNGPSVTLRVGDTFHEPANTLINQFDATAEGAEFLAWGRRVTSADSPLLTAH
jgi:quercetin dioxygenase-like cupin family protein